MATTFLLIAAGLVMSVAGAEALVRGASRLAAAAGVSPLVIGLTVVAYGTSAPEMVVSTLSALSGQADIAIGNVVGSNIFNVLFILGLSALIVPLVVSQQLIRLDVPVMVAVSLLAALIGLDGRIGRLEGLLLCAGAIAYTGFLIYHGRREACSASGGKAADRAPAGRAGLGSPLYILGGLALLVLGSRWLVAGAVDLARFMGVSELVVGLTIVAAGTSLPEVATSIVASLRNERDIAVGNVVGSNIFNILAVLGLSAVVSPEGVAVSATALRFDIPVMVAVAVACLPVFFTGNVISRWEGGVFLGYYAAYSLFLILAAAHHAALPVFSRFLLWFVLPLTALTLGVVTLRALRARSRK